MIHKGVPVFLVTKGQAWFQTRHTALVETELLMSSNQQLVCWSSSQCYPLSVPAKAPTANSQFKAYFLTDELIDVLTCLICIMCMG